MPLSHRACAMGAGAVVLACALSAGAVRAGGDWPAHPVRILVGFGAGGGTDVATRIIADPLGEVLGQRIVVENKAGAGGTIAADAIAKSQKDGYNAVMASPAHTVAAAMIRAQLYDAVKDFSPVGVVANSAFVVVTKSDFPAKDLRELIALAKQSPGKLNYGTVTIGSTQHITAELLRQRAGIDAQHVSFRTTPEVVTALIRGDVSYAVELAHAVRGQVQAGDLKILAVMTANRWPSRQMSRPSSSRAFRISRCSAGTGCCSRPASRRRSSSGPTTRCRRSCCARISAVSSTTSARSPTCRRRRNSDNCLKAKLLGGEWLPGMRDWNPISAG
jgi:tripartite-type tricarboxylate transporter receptor subunit TctC